MNAKELYEAGQLDEAIAVVTAEVKRAPTNTAARNLLCELLCFAGQWERADKQADAIALDGTEREELVGTRTTLDVLNAQQLLLNAQVQQVQNIAQLVNNSYSVASAMGRLTAKDLALPVQEYDDLKYYDAVHYAGFGTGESADEDAGIAPNGALLAAPAAPGITDDATGAPTP